MGEDIHKYQTRFEAGLRNLWKSSICKENKDFIEKFCYDCLSQGIKPGRVQKYVYILRKIAEWLNKEFDKAVIEDIKFVVAKIESSPFTDWTKHDYKVSLKKFFKWVKKTKEPEEVKWIKIPNLKNKKLPEDLLSEEDVKNLINAADHPRDKAFISVLYESGCRIGEISNIKIKNISFDKHGAQIIVSGKTGARRVRIVSSVPYLTDWLNRHPTKNPEDWLWISHYKNKKIEYESHRRILRDTKNKAGISKSVNPHNFRHSRATFLANFLTEAQMKEYFGWVQASEMASVYVHLSGRDVDKALLKVYGIAEEENGKESLLKPKKCYRCGESNPSTNILCSRCSAPLDEKTIAGIIEKDMQRSAFESIMDKLWEDHSFKQFFFERIKELKEHEAA